MIADPVEARITPDTTCTTTTVWGSEEGSEDVVEERQSNWGIWSALRSKWPSYEIGKEGSGEGWLGIAPEVGDSFENLSSPWAEVWGLEWTEVWTLYSHSLQMKVGVPLPLGIHVVLKMCDMASKGSLHITRESSLEIHNSREGKKRQTQSSGIVAWLPP